MFKIFLTFGYIQGKRKKYFILYKFGRSFFQNSQFTSHAFSESDSEENIESLLSEYQHYLDKAHKQRINYIERSKVKNKVPLVRRDKFTKFNPTHQNNYNDKFDIIAKTKPLSFINHLNTAMPQVSDLIQNNSGENMSLRAKSFLLNLPNLWPHSIITKSMDSSCYCKENQIPCRCACKQCYIAFNPSTSYFKRADNIQKSIDETLPDFDHGTEQSKNVMSNNLNIILKIALQFHNTSANDLSEGEKVDVPREIISKINLPPYINFPTLFELAKYKNNLMNYNHPFPLHKITIHKRKKSRVNNSNKKHKSKKINSSRFYKDDSDMQVKDINEPNDNDQLQKNLTFYTKDYTKVKLPINITQSYENKLISLHDNITTKDSSKNEMFPFVSNILMNTSKQSNGTNEIQKIDNSIEADSEKNTNITALETPRLKRDLIQLNTGSINESHVNTTKQQQKLDKMSDSELLYWPESNKNNNSEILEKNITEYMSDKITKKTKMNMTHDMIRANRTAALERAIFGDVDWNDTDEVVPIFMSFVGKYVRGALTFCSENICHSIKCDNKVCTHRTCTPEHRYNKNGHCMGNDSNGKYNNLLGF